MIKMKKQTVIVTGASSGIGKAIAQYFLEKGDNVVINSVRKDNLEKTFAEFNNTDRLVMVTGDISDKRVGQQLVAHPRLGAHAGHVEQGVNQFLSQGTLHGAIIPQ